MVKKDADTPRGFLITADSKGDREAVLRRLKGCGKPGGAEQER